MKNQRWLRIIDEYKDFVFPRKNEILEMFEIELHNLNSLDFENGIDQTKDSLLRLIEATRRMYEENTVEERRIDLWSIHLQSITMLENILLINSKKISS